MAHPTNPYTGNSDNVRTMDVGDRQVCLDGTDGYIWGDVSFPAGANADTVFRNTFGYDRPSAYQEYVPGVEGVHVHQGKLIDEGERIGLPHSVDHAAIHLHPRVVNLSPFAPGQANSADAGKETTTDFRAIAETQSAAARALTDAAFPGATEDPGDAVAGPSDDAPGGATATQDVTPADPQTLTDPHTTPTPGEDNAGSQEQPGPANQSADTQAGQVNPDAGQSSQ